MKRFAIIATLVLALTGCGEKIITKTETVKVAAPPKTIVRTIKVHDRSVPVPKKRVTPQPSRLPPPPAGVFQIGDKRLLVRAGFEANMHHLCEGRYNAGDTGEADNYVYSVGAINGDFLVECVGTVGKRWADLPYTPVPQKVPHR